MKNIKKQNFIIGICLLATFAIFFIATLLFEKERPQVRLKHLPDYISSKAISITVIVKDKDMGIRRIEMELMQKNKKKLILKKDFPYKGLLNRKGIHIYKEEVRFAPSEWGFSDGKLILNIKAWDYSLRNHLKGNYAYLKKEVILDTIPPSIVPISRLNYFYIGGSGLITYRCSNDTIKTGIYLNKLFFPAYPVKADTKEKYYVCYIAIPYNLKPPANLYIWAEDKAQNRSIARFYYRIKRKNFRKRKITITDNFLKKVLPYFSYLSFPAHNMRDIDKFLYINRNLRKKNNLLIQKLCANSSKKRLWRGAWQALRGAKCTAKFGDRRSYFYINRLIDRQVHLGIDLASVANSPVPASNSGRVLYAGRLGIYGLSVIIDHGQGIFSLYGHMSRIDVTKGQMVEKGQVLGLTGQTGLAGGDHLHFSIIINGIFVNPEEWLDYHWLRDNIIRKLKRIGGKI